MKVKPWPRSLRKSLSRLTSGSRIVSPEDDAAGLSQSAILHNESLRDKAASQVLQNGISFLQAKDGYLQKVQKALDRMSELSVMALDATKTNTDRSNYNSEFQTLTEFINDIGGKSFNGKSLLYSAYEVVDTGSPITWTAAKADAISKGGNLATISSPGEQNYIIEQLGGSFAPGTEVWIGLTDEASEGDFKWITGESFLYSNWDSSTGEPNDAGGEDYATLRQSTLKWNDYPDNGYNAVRSYILEKPSNLIINGEGDTVDLPSGGIPYLTDTLSTTLAAQTALTHVKSSIEEIARQRGAVGAILQRVQSEDDSLSIKTQNLDSSVSRIRDTDIAKESMNFARQSILVQSGTAMQAQANTLPRSVLKLLG